MVDHPLPRRQPAPGSTKMVRDTRTSGVPAVPYVLLTIATGSLGLLSYLLHVEWRRRREGASTAR